MKQYNILGGIDNLTEKKKMKNYKELENEVIKWADNKGILSNVKNLQDVQAKLKSTRNQLYRKRATYNKKRNGSNGKKAVKKKKASANTKKTNI